MIRSAVFPKWQVIRTNPRVAASEAFHWLNLHFKQRHCHRAVENRPEERRFKTGHSEGRSSPPVFGSSIKRFRLRVKKTSRAELRASLVAAPARLKVRWIYDFFLFSWVSTGASLDTITFAGESAMTWARDAGNGR